MTSIPPQSRDSGSDPLTGLANWTWLSARITDALVGQFATGPPVLVCCDLTGFRTINHALGYRTGDALLRQVAQRLLPCAGRDATVARLGADDFALLLPCAVSEDEPGLVAKRIIHALRPPFLLRGREQHVDVSVGFAIASADDDAETLLRNADLAMRQARADGPYRQRRYVSAMHTRVCAAVHLEEDLRHAVDRDELLLQYQPIVALSTGECIGAEALIRWQHPQQGLLGPDLFLPLAEANEGILDMGRWVVGRASADAACWPVRHGPLGLSVNVAPQQLMNDGHVADLVASLTSGPFPADRISLEVTERSLLDGDRPRNALLALQKTGARLALDDFGTGYSSIAHLRDHRVDVLKVDRSYASDLLGPARQRTLVLGLLQLGSQLGISCTAEGVESREQAAAFAAAGCSNAQGFLFARPMSHEKFMTWIEARHPVLPSPRDAPEGSRDAPAGSKAS